ncbi:hypothetical protein BGZ94_001689 [Podila epigama]|nr:hypothetical protein BGZ94_001689 [Podila epigama]
MLRYVKEGAIDFLASTLPQSLLESIRQVSEDDFLAPPHLSHRQPRRRHPVASRNSTKAITPWRRHQHGYIDSLELDSSQEQQRQLNLSDPSSPVTKPSIMLPYEILAIIFQYLPASDLFSVLAVCRFWREIALVETRHIDLSEGFPTDCLGLGSEEYSDFDFVYNLFSIFPLISSLVIKDRYLRDKDLRVVTAGILAGKMAFTKAGPSVESTSFLAAQKAVAAQRRQRQQQKEREQSKNQNHNQSQNQESQNNMTFVNTTSCESKYTHCETGNDSTINNKNNDNTTNNITTTTPRPLVKMVKGTIKEELKSFSDSVATYVLIPQTRKTLRKKILAQFELNLEQKEIQDTCWMLENGINPSNSSISDTASLWSSASSTVVPSERAYPLVPMTHYRFQDCCFANDWGAHMDRNKLPMIGLAAAISGQGLYVDLEGSYGAPSRSIRTMLGFCFGQNCVISLHLNFRHTHMELEHVTELLSENPILFKVDIVDSPAYHELIRLQPLRGLGSLLERMHELCHDLDEQGLETTLQSARTLLSQLAADIAHEEAQMHMQMETQTRSGEGRSTAVPVPVVPVVNTEPTGLAARGPVHDPTKPIMSLVQFLSFPQGTKADAKLRTATILLKGVIENGIAGLINTRDMQSEQSLLHTLAWRKEYSSFVTAALHTATHLPTPPAQSHDRLSSSPSSFPFFSSTFPPTRRLLGNNEAERLSTAARGGATVTTVGFDTFNASSSLSAAATDGSSPGTTLQSSTLSSLLALTSSLSFKRLNLPPVTSLFSNSEDVPESDNDNDKRLVEDCGQEGECSQSLQDDGNILSGTPPSPTLIDSSQAAVVDTPGVVIPEQHPVSISLRMAKMLLDLQADPNVYNKDGRSAVVCASYMGFQPMETLLIQNRGYSKELIRIRETM